MVWQASRLHCGLRNTADDTIPCQVANSISTIVECKQELQKSYQSTCTTLLWKHTSCTLIWKGIYVASGHVSSKHEAFYIALVTECSNACRKTLVKLPDLKLSDKDDRHTQHFSSMHQHVLCHFPSEQLTASVHHHACLQSC